MFFYNNFCLFQEKNTFLIKIKIHGGKDSCIIICLSCFINYHVHSFTHRMWTWMHKNIHRINAPHISKELCREPRQQPSHIAQMVVDAVAHYNEMLPLLEHFERKNVNDRLIKEAEEEAAKEFLDGILDMMQRETSEREFFQ